MEERDELLNAAEAPDEAAEYAPDENEAGDGEITLAGWLWRLCIPIIPCAGIVIYIVLLCMWAFGKKQTESMRVWAKAALIATIIKIVFVGVILLVLQLNLHLFNPLIAIIKKVF